MVFYNLKALIKAIRACRTLADERALIIKESAVIRTSFKEEDSYTRHHNVAKLLYIHMLGYPAHFGQIECLKLVASPRFTDKRLGYLGIMLLLDENQELLTLVTNSLKNDMNHPSASTVALALCTFANISSEEMARDLVSEIERCLSSGNAYIRKKAALAALRCIHKVPDLTDHFEERVMTLLGDRNHGVLLTGITLLSEMVRLVGSAPFKRAVPLLVKLLKQLVTTGYSPEHDVSGITDPFLQVKVLRLLRLLGIADVEASETMNDILAQVATNTESAKNVGNSILYEAVLTILDIEADSGLRVMAINILGKFLGNRDNNIRYVALNTLNKVVGIDTNAVQRHRSTILDCLRDGDISIRRRALELSYALINESNVRVLTRELLAFLEVADAEFKLGMTTQICAAAERFAPNKRWHIDTSLRVLKLAGNYVKEEVLSGFIRLLIHTPELQAYTVSKLYAALRGDVSQESLTLAGVWVIGEFGDILLSNDPGLVTSSVPEDEDSQPAASAMPTGPVNEKDVVDLLENVLVSPYTNGLIRQFVLVAATKLSTRIQGTDQIGRLFQIVKRFESSIELELQQRSIEFGMLMTMGDIKAGVLERMPPPEIRATVMGTVSEKRAVGSLRTDRDTLGDLIGDESAPSSATGAPVKKQTDQDLLADIFGSSSLDDRPVSPPASVQQGGKSSMQDILGLFGDGAAAAPSPVQSPPPFAAQSATSPLSMGGSHADFFAGLQSSSPAAPAAPSELVAFEGHGLRVTFAPTKDAARPNVLNVLTSFAATGGETIQGVNFQAAVRKTMKLQMLAASNTNVAPGSVETQQMRIMTPPGTAIKLRLRIGFTSGGQVRMEQTDFTFPDL